MRGISVKQAAAIVGGKLSGKGCLLYTSDAADEL